MVKTWDTPSFTAVCDGVSCGHDHTDVDRATNCARNTMARYKIDQATVFQNLPDGSRLVRRPVQELKG